MKLIDVLNQTNGYNNLCEKLFNNDYYLSIKNIKDKIEFFNKKDNSKIIINLVNDFYITFNCENKEQKRFFSCDWYLGCISGLSLEHIEKTLNSENFKKFVNCNYSYENDIIVPQNHKEPEVLLNTDKVARFDKLFNNYSSNLFELKYYYNIGEPNMYFIIKNDKASERYDIDLTRNIAKFKDVPNFEGKDFDDLYNFIKMLLDDIFEGAMNGVHSKLVQQDLENQKQKPVLNKEIDKNIFDSLVQEQIKMICSAISDLLLYKNQKYGNSALEPNNIFANIDGETGIRIRLDDKLGRIKNSENGKLRVNDIVDIIGYLVLLLIAKNTDVKEIEKFKD